MPEHRRPRRRNGSGRSARTSAWYRATTRTRWPRPRPAPRRAGPCSCMRSTSRRSSPARGQSEPELDEQVPDASTVIVAVGGGGLIGGIAAWFTRACPHRRRRTGHGCSTLFAALAAGRFLWTSRWAASRRAAARRRAGRNDRLRHRAAVRRTGGARRRSAIRDAQRLLWDATRIVAEPGAAALAGLTVGAYVPGTDQACVVVLSGANTDPASVG